MPDTSMPSMILTSMLAHAFADKVLAALSPEQVDEMRTRNTMYDYISTGSCASHDFLDANVAMEQAFIQVLGHAPDFGEDDVPPSWDDVDRWHLAWEIARQRLSADQTIPTLAPGAARPSWWPAPLKEAE